MTGTVKFFNGSKGFGFITNDETGEDIFVHVTSLDGINLNEGDKVSYNEGEGRKGKMAILPFLPSPSLYDTLSPSLRLIPSREVT